MSVLADTPFPCADCGCPVWDHQPIWNVQSTKETGPLYTRGACINEPAGWAEDEDTGERVHVPARTCPCTQYSTPTDQQRDIA